MGAQCELSHAVVMQSSLLHSLIPRLMLNSLEMRLMLKLQIIIMSVLMLENPAHSFKISRIKTFRYYMYCLVLLFVCGKLAVLLPGLRGFSNTLNTTTHHCMHYYLCQYMYYNQC